jgi:hypothetical protein
MEIWRLPCENPRHGGEKEGIRPLALEFEDLLGRVSWARSKSVDQPAGAKQVKTSAVIKYQKSYLLKACWKNKPLI